MSFVAFHGTDGDTVITILASGLLRPKSGRIYLAATARETYVHGGDVRRAAAFSLELCVHADPTSVRRLATRGSPNTIVIETTGEVRVDILSLRVRKPSRDGWLEETVSAADIERYLRGDLR